MKEKPRRWTLTDPLLRARREQATASGEVVVVADATQRGLRARIFPSGTVVFSVTYRMGTKVNTAGCGRWGRVTIAQARKQARKVLANRELGINVQEEKNRQREAAANALSVDELLDEYITERATRSRRTRPVLAESTVQNYRGWAKLLAGLCSDIRLLSRRAIKDRLRKIADENGDVTANRCHQLLKASLYWAVDEDKLPQNPMGRMAPPAAEGSRERTLSDDEVAALWKATGDRREGAFVRLLLLTGARRGELAEMTWDQLDVDADIPLWTIPGAQRKGGRPHAVPLSPLAVKTLQALPQAADGPVFAGMDLWNPTRWLDGPEGLREALAAAVKAATRRKVEPWTLHDLRRTVRTGLGRLGVHAETSERVIGHKLAGIQAVYNLHDYLAEKATALNAWAAHVERVVSGKKGAAQVVPLRA